MSTISYSEGGNIGGIRECYATLYYLLTSLNPITFRAGFGWDEMEFLPESASIKDTATRTENGIEYNYTVVFTFNKQSYNMYHAFAQYIGTVGILKVTDNNGLTRLLGTLKNRVTIKTEGDTGDAATAVNDYKITATWLNDKPAIVI